MLKRKDLNFNKRGNIQSIFAVMIILLILGFVIGMGGYIIPQVTDGLRETEINDSEGAREALDGADDVAGLFDTVFLIFFSLLIISTLGSAFLIRTHPIFIPIFIFFLGIGIFVAVIGESVYISFAENPILEPTMSGQTYTQSILDNFPFIMMGLGFLSMVIIFSRGGESRLWYVNYVKRK